MLTSIQILDYATQIALDSIWAEMVQETIYNNNNNNNKNNISITDTSN